MKMRKMVTRYSRLLNSETDDIKFEPLKNKEKFKPLKAHKLKFVPFKSNFSILNTLLIDLFHSSKNQYQPKKQ